MSRLLAAFSLLVPSGLGLLPPVRAHGQEHGATTGAGTQGPSAGLVPWRDPEGDVALFFPGVHSYRSETRILSHRRLALARQLGRPPAAEELLLRYYRVHAENQTRGFIIVRRIKGEHGAIELVLAVTPTLTVRGVRLQRLREPEPVAQDLMSPRWSAAFAGKTASSRWRVGVDLPVVSRSARRSAQAIADGARAALILLRMGLETAD